jgi:hypothetical protein
MNKNSIAAAPLPCLGNRLAYIEFNFENISFLFGPGEI